MCDTTLWLFSNMNVMHFHVKSPAVNSDSWSQVEMELGSLEICWARIVILVLGAHDFFHSVDDSSFMDVHLGYFTIIMKFLILHIVVFSFYFIKITGVYFIDIASSVDGFRPSHKVYRCVFGHRTILTDGFPYISTTSVFCWALHLRLIWHWDTIWWFFLRNC